MDAGSITRVRLCSVYMRTECLACPAVVVTTYTVVGESLPALRIVYTLLERRINTSGVATASPFYRLYPPPKSPSSEGDLLSRASALRVEHGCSQHYPRKTLQRIYAYRVSCMSGRRSYGLRRCEIESSCTPDRVYLARTSYKYVGSNYGLRRFTDCTLPLNPPPRRGTCCRAPCALRVEPANDFDSGRATF